MAGIDWTNPCDRALALRNAYYALLTGGRAQEITYQDGNAQRTVRYHSSSIDINRLRAEMLAADTECLTGVPMNMYRQAIQGGALDRTLIFGGEFFAEGEE